MKQNKLLTGVTASTLLLGIAFLGATTVSATTQVECTQDPQTLQSQAFGQSDIERGYASDNMQGLMGEDVSLSLDGYDLSTDELEAMLTVLITDEYNARAEYEAIEAAYGAQEPFTSLIEAETKHADALANLFEKYGLEVPSDNSEDNVVIPDSLQEAYEIGIAAEIANAALYEGYLDQDLPSNVENVLTNLMDASLDNHLVTFEAYAEGEIPTNLHATDDISQANMNADNQQANMPSDRGNSRR